MHLWSQKAKVAFCRLLPTDRPKTIRGNIFAYDYKIDNGTVICDVTACTCKLDAVVEKWI